MVRNTITDVREKVSLLNDLSDKNLSFQCWGVGTNKYYLMDDDTGEQIGTIHSGATEFLAFLDGYYQKLRR